MSRDLLLLWFGCHAVSIIILGFAIRILAKKVIKVEKYATKCYSECLQILRYINNIQKENSSGDENVES